MEIQSCKVCKVLTIYGEYKKITTLWKNTPIYNFSLLSKSKNIRKRNYRLLCNT
ncbi:hypothetical protein KL86DYS1_10746 [uncultured Dysgonomonas sp.]|uniref:Uncharacterized protein n=1 Tax=uncultured Dysgonomonas sp. TaxID=206096 RepID=A0A212J0K0_9BACT|nr:hypothetical protein KL86DYS1_10746 [uncultured Dysgonomonas sp.]